MNIRKHSALLLVLIALLLVPATVSAESAVSYDNYTTGADSDSEIYLNLYSGQTFTAFASYELDKIAVNVFKEGTPGTLTVSIQSTDPTTHLPSGTNLCYGTLADTYVGTAGAWYLIDVDNITIVEGTTYAIVANSTGTSSTVNFHWRTDGTAGAYSGGSEWNSADAGVGWAPDTDDDCMFELFGMPVNTIHSAAVFNNYYAPGDWLVVMAYDNSRYQAYHPESLPQSQFAMQLLNGATVLAQSAFPQWGYKPMGIYLSAASVSSLSWGAAYTIRIKALNAPYTTIDYTLTAADWKGSDLTLLDDWCISIAHSIEDYYGTTLVVLTAEKGEVLNEEGGVIFSIGIPGLGAQRGEYLYQLYASSIPYTEPTWTSAYSGTFDPWYTQLGPDISSLVNSTADLVDADGLDLLRILLVGAYAIVAIIMVANGLNLGAFAVLSPFLIAGYMLKILPWAGLGVGVAILVMLAVRQLWWKST